MAENNNELNKINNENDKFFKGMMSLQIVVRAYAEQFLPKDRLDKLDLDTLELDTTSYITDELSEYFSDMVWTCRFKNSNRKAKIAFLHEHKSYKPNYPHFQLLDYIRGSWKAQLAQNKTPILMVPIILYHGTATWELESFESYFGEVEPEFLCHLPCFDIIFVNLQKYSDGTIRTFESIFLQKSLIAFKHHLDKAYLRIHIVELLLVGYGDKKNDQTRRFIRMFGVYLTSVSGMSSREIRHEINNEINKSDNNLKSEAMSIFEELIEEGIEKGILVIKHWQKGMEPYMIANLTGFSIEQVKEIITKFESNT
jgi:predicted transposase/invertase (TIGR01784 family)